MRERPPCGVIRTWISGSGHCAAIVAVLTLGGSPACASPHGWGKASGIARDALVGAALGIPALQGDWQGDLQAAGSLFATGGETYALKELIHERRPDGSDRKSFPSGHASIAFAAAGTLENRYGWQAGLPALMVQASSASRASRRAGTIGTTSSRVPRWEPAQHLRSRVSAARMFGWCLGRLVAVAVSPWRRASDRGRSARQPHRRPKASKSFSMMVGERGFEPPAPASRRQCSTRLSYSPTERATHWGGATAAPL